MPKKPEGAVFASPAQIDHATARGLLPVQSPGGGERAAEGADFLPGRQMFAVSGRKASVGRRERSQGVVMTALPDLALPEAIEVFDHRLKTDLQRRSEDRRDLEREAEADHSAQDVRMVVSSLKTNIIAELSEARQPSLPSVREQRVDDEGGRRGLRRPGFAPDPQGSRREDLNNPKSSMRKSSITSKASSGASPAATAGRYQPGGGAARRTRR